MHFDCGSRNPHINLELDQSKQIVSTILEINMHISRMAKCIGPAGDDHVHCSAFEASYVPEAGTGIPFCPSPQVRLQSIVPALESAAARFF